MLKHAILMPLFVVAGLVAFICGIRYAVWLPFFTIVFLGLGFTIWGSFDIRLGYFTKTLYRKKRAKDKILALTFDDGPTAYTAEILALLAHYNSQATFFCIGKQMDEFPEMTRQILAKGHCLGNHTYSHGKNFGFLSTKQVLNEIQQCDAALQNHTAKPTTLFRPPFGVTNPSVARAVKQTKHVVIGWSNRSLDTVIKDEDRIYQRVVRKLRAGDIILFHDTSQRTVNVVKRLLPFLKAEGYRCVSVDDLLNLHGYEK